MEVPHEFYEKHAKDLVRVLQHRIRDTDRFYSLLRGDTNIVVQMNIYEVPDHNEALEIIQNNIQQIDFDIDAPKWCYLMKLKNGRWKISQQHKRLKRVTCPPWATLVHQGDVEYLQYPGLEFRYARWKGQDVDIRIAWTDDDMRFLDREMRAYRRLQGANLTYEVLAHIIDDEGDIIGIMTESMQGRPVRLKDKRLVFSEMTRLNSMGLVYEKPELSNILITKDNDVRLVQVYNIFPIPEDPKSAERKLSICWSMLRVFVFRALERGGACYAPHQFTWRVRVLVPLSDPERVLQGSKEWVVRKEIKRYIIGNPIVLMLEKARGQKRTASDYREDDSQEEDYPHPSKRTLQVILAPENQTPYTSSFSPSDFPGDSPHIPKPIRRERASVERTFAATNIVAPESSSIMEPSYAWIHDAPWLEPSFRSRFEVID